MVPGEVRRRELHQQPRAHVRREVAVPAEDDPGVILRRNALGPTVEARAAEPRIGLFIVVEDRTALGVSKDLGGVKGSAHHVVGSAPESLHVPVHSGGE